MDEGLRIIVEMSETIWKGFRKLLEDVTAEEANWRPLPQANSINLILRHLCIEAAEHARNMEQLEHPEQPESLPLDFERNLGDLEELYTRFVNGLRNSSVSDLRAKSARAYPGKPAPHFLAYHQVMHLAMHLGQISSIRNLYCRARGLPAKFFPDNPNFPQG